MYLRYFIHLIFSFARWWLDSPYQRERDNIIWRLSIAAGASVDVYESNLAHDSTAAKKTAQDEKYQTQTKLKLAQNFYGSQSRHVNLFTFSHFLVFRVEIVPVYPAIHFVRPVTYSVT